MPDAGAGFTVEDTTPKAAPRLATVDPTSL